MAVKTRSATAWRAGAVALCVAVMGGGVAALPAYGAAAGVAEVTGTNGTTVEYTARSGEFNDVFITVVNTIGGPRFQITDRVPITPGNGCFRPDNADLKKVRCTLLNVRKLKVDLADGNDVVINKTDTSSTLNGSDGDDHLFGGTGSDDLFGNEGDDLLDGGAGTDALIGGAGRDQLFGAQGDDSLLGEGGDDHADGFEGNDLVRGGDGNDELIGGAGRDRLFGENGDDVIEGDANNDKLFGGPGTDTLNGGLHDALPGDQCFNGETVLFCNP
jgi:Ca2+-binding RTX toxin-like protein